MSRSPSKLLRRRCKSSKCVRCSHLSRGSCVNKELSGQLSTKRSLAVVGSARDARTRAPGASVACVNDKRGDEVHRCSSGNSQGRPWESETPCQRLHYYAVAFSDHLSTALNGGGWHQSPSTTVNKAGDVGGGVLSVKTVTSQVRDRTFIYILLCIYIFFFYNVNIIFWTGRLREIVFLCLINASIKKVVDLYLYSLGHDHTTSCQLIAGSMEIPLKAVHMINSCFYPIGVISDHVWW